MIVYFEDGPITNESLYDDNGEEMTKVDAGTGYSNCRRKLRFLKENFPFDTKVYTNSLDAFSNFWTWNDEKKIPMIYIRNQDDEWTLISELYDGKLRIAQVLSKMYVNGLFGNDVAM